MSAEGAGGGAGGGSIWTSAASLIASPEARTAAVAICASAALLVTLRGAPFKKPPKAPDKDYHDSSSLQQQDLSPLRSRSRSSFSSFSLSESKNSVAIFWDVDNCSPPSGASGHTVAQAIRKAAQSAAKEFTRSESNVSIVSFKAYLELTTEGVPTSASKVLLHSELQGSGVSLIDTPKSGRKDVADKMMITDLLSFAIDKRPPALIVLLSGDRDFAYPLGILRNRGYEILLVVPPIGATPILEASANYVLRWRQDVLGLERDAQGRLYDKSSRIKEIEGKAYAKGSTATTRTTQGVQQPNSATTTLKGPGAPPVPSIFNPLVVALEQMRKEGVNRPLRSKCATRLLSEDVDVYKKAGATTWGDYAAVAEAAGIITLGEGSKPGMEWIALRSLQDNGSTLKLKAAEKSASEKNAAGGNLVKAASAMGNGKSAEPANIKAAEKAALEKNGALVSPQKNAAAISNGRGVEPASVQGAESSNLQALENSKKADAKKATEKDEATSSNVDIEDITIFYPLIELYHQVKAELPKSEYPTVSQMTAQVTRMWEVSMRDAYGRANVKTFAAYMDLAEQAKVGRLVKLGTKTSITIVHIHSKYVNMVMSPKKSDAKLRDASKTDMVTSESSSGLAGVIKKNKELKEAKELKEQAENGSAIVNTETISPQKSSSNEKNTLLHAHLPSGEKIHVSYFPLCNTLLTQRAEGKMTSLDTFIQGVLSKHNKIYHFVNTPEQFASYIARAERDNIVICEGKPGKRFIRLAPRLCIGEEEHNRLRREKYAAENGSKESSTPVVTIMQRQRSKSSEEEVAKVIEEQSSVSLEFGTEPATPAERVKFKPLVDVLVSLRRDSPETNKEAPLSKVSSTLISHCPIEGKLVSPGVWIQSQGYSGFVEYFQAAQKKGFIHLIKSVDDKVVLRIRLAEKYEAMFFPSG
jgi:hypothetical protein